MIQAILLLIQIMLWLSILALLFGLIRPVYVLWFLDRFNRLRVIRIYGTISLLLMVILIVYKIIFI